MADKYLNSTGVATIRDWANGKFATDADLTALAARVEDIIAEGGEPNTIETISVNGTNVPPDGNKNVALTIPTEGNAQSTSGYVTFATYTAGLATKADSADVPTNTSDLINDGDGSDNNSPFATEAYVQNNGGTIQKVKRNGVELTIDSSDKSVNILVPDTAATTSADGLMSAADKTKLDEVESGAQANVQSNWNEADSTSDAYIQNKPTIPADLSDLTNTGQDPYATMSDVESAQVGALKPKGSVAFASLPALTAANLNNMYNVSDSFTTTADFIEGAGLTFPAGTNVAIINTGTDQNPVYKYDAMPGATDLSAYWTSTTGMNNTLEALTVSEVNAILTPSNP